jgi:hypothetical protein
VLSVCGLNGPPSELGTGDLVMSTFGLAVGSETMMMLTMLGNGVKFCNATSRGVDETSDIVTPSGAHVQELVSSVWMGKILPSDKGGNSAKQH